MLNVHNLNDGRVQALRALQSVDDILGEDDTRRNENGELVNEDGLPIIDITEPIDEMDTPSLSAATDEDDIIMEDNYPEPVFKVSPKTLEINKKHRDKILDLLEDEELREERRTQRELERKREAARNEMQKRMTIQGAELEKKRQAKEIEKRMAKALVDGLGESSVPTLSKKAVSQSQNKKPKKTVTFSNPSSPSESGIPAQVKPHSEAVDWGDVIVGRIPNKPTGSRSQPMKMNVIERTPAPKPSPPPEPPQPADPVIDSDDETDSDRSDSTIALDSGSEDVVLSAHRHRELALEYHRRREALSSSAAAIQPEGVVLVGGHTVVNPDDWDSKEVPYEATLAHPPPKPPVSKFKSSLVNQTRSSSPNFSASILPPSEVSKSIKMGKLVDGNLVAGHEDEEQQQQEAREEEEIRKLLLKSIEDSSGIAAQIMGPVGSSSYLAKPGAGTVISSSRVEQPSVKPKTNYKASRFKVNRTQDRVSPSAFAGPLVSADASGTGSCDTRDIV